MPVVDIKKLDAAEFLNYMNNVDYIYENADDVIDNFEPDEVVAMLESTVYTGERAWKFQSDLLKNIHDRSKFGQKAVENVAKKVGISRSYAFDLLKINQKIFSKDPSTKLLPNLTISHYFAVIRALSKIKNPIEILNKASDEEWSTVDLKKYLKNNGKEVTKEILTDYYKLEKLEDFDQSTKTWASSKRIAGGAYIMKDSNGDEYLELKTIVEK